MDKEVSIVLSVERCNYRKVAQEWYGLTDEQMVGMDVHHNPARHEGGRNIPEHLYVYHNTLHAAVHEDEFVLWSRKNHEVKNEEGKSTLAVKAGKAAHRQKDETGKSTHAVRAGKAAHTKRDENGKSVHGVKASQAAHAEKDELGRSVHGVKGAERLHAERDELGRSVHTLELLHTEVDELGRSVTAMRMNEKVHAERDDMGRSVHGVKAAERLHAYKWEDPDHPELGQTGAGPLSRMQRSRGYPHGPENRRRVYLIE